MVAALQSALGETSIKTLDVILVHGAKHRLGQGWRRTDAPGVGASVEARSIGCSAGEAGTAIAATATQTKVEAEHFHSASLMPIG